MYIIGTEVDKNYKLKLTAPTMVYGTSEFCKPDDMYILEIDVPNTEHAKSKTFSVKLYASNSNSNPYVDQGDNYWKNLVPTWKFYDENKKIIYDLTITANQRTSTGLHGSVKFHYVDDMPSDLDEPIFIWATLNLDDFTKHAEVVEVKSERYEPPAYANSKVIAVTTTTINQIVPTKISITRNSIDLLSTGIYWSNQKIPFIATVNSDHYATFRENSEVRNDLVEFSSDLVYNFPLAEDLTEHLKGNIGISYNVDDVISPSSLIDKYLYYTRNMWDFISTYVPPENVLETSGPIPQNFSAKPPKANVVVYSDIMENMDWPTFNDLQARYYDIDLDKYFVKINKNDIITLMVGDKVEVQSGDFAKQIGTIVRKYDDLMEATVELDNIEPTTRIVVPYNLLRKVKIGEYGNVIYDDSSVLPSGFDYDEADLFVLTLDNYETLIKEHRIFDYIPYALRIVDTLSMDGDIPIKTTWCEFSAFDESKAELDFKLLDKTNGYNYKIGGYSFGMTYCPDLSGKDRWGTIYASASFDQNVARRGIKFHQIKYSVLTDGDGLYLVDDRNNISQDSMLAEIARYLEDNSIYPQTVPDHNITDDGSLIGTDYKLGGVTVKEYGASWVTQDPLYNSWIVDSNSGHVTKIDIKGEIIHDINLTSAVGKYLEDARDLQQALVTAEEDILTDENMYLLNQEITDDILKYWNEIVTTDGTAIISPNCVVLDSKNQIYVTSYDQMILVKMDGMDGKVLGAWPFPDQIIKDDFPYSKTYSDMVSAVLSAEASGIPVDDERFELNAGWKIVGVDTNEYDSVAVLFQTKLTELKDEVYDLPCSVKVAMFDGMNFTDWFTLYDKEQPDDGSSINIPNDSWIDTSHVVFRSTESFDYIYVAGSTNPTPADGEESPKQQKYPKKAKKNGDKFYETVFVWRYSIDKSTGEKNLETLFEQTYDDDVPTYHHCVGSMFVDVDYNLWFTVNKDGYQRGKADGNSEVYVVKDARANSATSAVRVTGFPSNINIAGISQLSTFEMLVLENTASGGMVSRYKFSSDDNSVRLNSNKQTSLPSQSKNENFGGQFIANGDWTGADYLNKYARMVDDIETVSTEESDDNKIRLYAYENYYIRKHNEEWDVAEHAKIPVIHTQFPEDNPELFKSIGITLGVDEHKQYSIGKKLFEGIANQVNNIHDIDECHIDSIYNIAHKEDVNIDKFILSYPEELRRMVDLMSITRKKLWGKRCDCTQNYFKTKDRTATRYCTKCRHSHKTNLGRLIDPFNDDIWRLTKYRVDYIDGVKEKEWYFLRDMIYAQSQVVNVVFEVDPPIECTRKELHTALTAIVPVNQMLAVFSEELGIEIEPLTIKNCSYDVVLTEIRKAVGWIHDYLMSMVNAYIIEDKFNRNDSYTRINMSARSYREANEILAKIRNDEYLSDDEKTMRANGETDAKIILQVSVENIAEQAQQMIDKRIEEEEALHGKLTEEQKEEIYAEVAGKITAAQVLAIHTSFFVADKWFNYCYWRLIPRTCSKLNTGVINWDSKYTTLPEFDDRIKRDWYYDPSDEETPGQTGTMEKILNYILHNGMLFHRNQEYIDD